MAEYMEQCRKCYHFQVCAQVMKNQLFIRRVMLKEENPQCEHFVPAADVAEVRHGEWKAKLVLNISTNPYIGDEYYQQCAVCSECGCKVDEVIQKN